MEGSTPTDLEVVAMAKKLAAILAASPSKLNDPALRPALSSIRKTLAAKDASDEVALEVEAELIDVRAALTIAEAAKGEAEATAERVKAEAERTMAHGEKIKEAASAAVKTERARSRKVGDVPRAPRIHSLIHSYFAFVFFDYVGPNLLLLIRPSIDMITNRRLSVTGPRGCMHCHCGRAGGRRRLLGSSRPSPPSTAAVPVIIPGEKKTKEAPCLAARAVLRGTENKHHARGEFRHE